MNFSTWAIKNPIPSIVFFILLTFAGLVSFFKTGVQDFPDIELPMVTVSATLPGAAPAQMETEVARKIENSIATLQGIKNIYTNILDGTATINVEFVLEKGLNEATNEVRDAVSQIRADLPPELRDPVIQKASNAGRPILTYVVSSESQDEEALSWFVDNAATKRVLSVQGVGKIARLGGVTREVLVELNQSKMSAIGVTAADMSHALRRVQQEAPGGRGDISGAEQSVRTIATVAAVAELQALRGRLPQALESLPQGVKEVDSTIEASKDVRVTTWPTQPLAVMSQDGEGASQDILDAITEPNQGGIFGRKPRDEGNKPESPKQPTLDFVQRVQRWVRDRLLVALLVAVAFVAGVLWGRSGKRLMAAPVSNA